MLAISNKMAKVMKIIRTRILSDSAAMTGKSLVIRKDSMRNSPMEISTMMMTRAAMAAVRYAPMKLVPPTISAIGRAINVKLMAAPTVATARTNIETKKYTTDDDERIVAARSSPRTIASYSSMWRSMETERSRTLVTLLLTRSSESLMRRL